MKNPAIRPHLLWEYNLDTFDFQKMAVVVIERVIERGNEKDWQAMAAFYPQDLILEIAEKSTRLSERDKYFTTIFLNSPLMHAL
ncbi:MAG: hypothetical protein R2879_17110 [Saprospiraceae bacterium]